MEYYGLGFCEDIDCGDLGWQRWLIVNDKSIWTISELRTVKQALLSTKFTLESNGFDWQEVIGSMT